MILRKTHNDTSLAKTPNTPIVNTGKQESVLFNVENLIMRIASIIVHIAIISEKKIMKRIIISFLLLSINLFAAEDCGVNIYNTATGKLHKKFLNGNYVHPKNKNIVQKRCTTQIRKNEFDINSFDVIAECMFEEGDKLFIRSTHEYDDAGNYGNGFIATYSYNMFAYEILCENK